MIGSLLSIEPCCDWFIAILNRAVIGSLLSIEPCYDWFIAILNRAVIGSSAVGVVVVVA